MDNNRDAVEKIKEALRRGDTASLLSSLSQKDLQVLRSFMKNDAARKKLLASPEARAVISKFLGE